MNFSANLDFGKNGRIFKNFEEFKALSTINICLAVISSFIILALVYYFLQFKRREGNAKFFNKKLISLTAGLLTGSLLIWILNFIFYYSASSIFSTATVAQNVIITFLAIGLALVFSCMCLIWFKIPYYGVVISEDQFWFLGENLDFNKVTKIINDDKSKTLFINYTASARTFKYYRVKSNSDVGKFLLNNLPTTLTYELGNQTDYFKELVKTLPSREK